MTTSVLGSSGAELMWCTMSVIDLIVPFLSERGQWHVMAGNATALGETNILKLPPTKNWRAMVAVGSSFGCFGYL